MVSVKSGLRPLFRRDRRRQTRTNKSRRQCKSVSGHHEKRVAPRLVQAGQEHQKEPVLNVQARPSSRSGTSKHEDLLTQKRVLGQQRRARANGVRARCAGERGSGADGPERVLDELSDAAGHGTDQAAQHLTTPNIVAWGPASRRAVRDGVSARSPSSRVDEESSQHGGPISRSVVIPYVQASRFAGHPGRPHRCGSRRTCDPQGGRGVYIRAERDSLPPHASNMLAVRIGQLTARGLPPRKTRSLVGCSPLEGAVHVGEGPSGAGSALLQVQVPLPSLKFLLFTNVTADSVFI